MACRHEPVTMGSPRSQTADTGAFRVTEAWFPPGSVLPAHTHDRAIMAVMLGGSFVTKIATKEIDCDPATIWIEPCEELHANFVGTRGANVLVIQPSPARQELLAPFARLLTEVSHAKDQGIASDARRVALELSQPDSLSPLMMDSLIVLALARSARVTGIRRASGNPPRWLERSRELIHARFREGIDLVELADTAQVSPWRLAREFRKHFHSSVGEYARDLRMSWALDQLTASELPISAVGLAAGYADQSHFTRACKAATGVAPADYRRRKLRT